MFLPPKTPSSRPEPSAARRSGGTCSWNRIDKNRSLDYAALWAASLGMTEINNYSPCFPLGDAAAEACGCCRGRRAGSNATPRNRESL